MCCVLVERSPLNSFRWRSHTVWDLNRFLNEKFSCELPHSGRSAFDLSPLHKMNKCGKVVVYLSDWMRVLAVESSLKVQSSVESTGTVQGNCFRSSFKWRHFLRFEVFLRHRMQTTLSSTVLYTMCSVDLSTDWSCQGLGRILRILRTVCGAHNVGPDDTRKSCVVSRRF